MMGMVVVVVGGGNENVLEPDLYIIFALFWRVRLRLSCGGEGLGCR